MKKLQYALGVGVLIVGGAVGTILLKSEHPAPIRKIVNVPISNSTTPTPTTEGEPVPVDSSIPDANPPASDSPDGTTESQNTPTQQATVPVYYVPAQASSSSFTVPVVSNPQP